ncbi:MAG: extracellular solute-binding protein [Chloroflexi bacterium]|nr:extracellular solute-binding protein [Chloroflexota bacterium]
MTKLMTWFSLVLIAGLLLAACGPAAAPVAGPTPPPAKEGKPAVQADWEQKWNNVLAEARKEGTVSVYILWRPETRTALTPAFKNKYGINVEFTPFSRGSDLLAKVQAEQRAGLFNADVFGAGNPTLLVTMKPENLLGSLKPMLILPEVLDPKGWRAGNVPFTDEQGLAISLINVTIRTMVYNTTLVKEGEITSYEDLLKPQYKGKLTLNDPTVTGSGNAAITHLGQALWGEQKAVDFLRRLIREQEVVIQRDNRIHMESVARGKYAIALAPLPDLIAEFQQVGAPIKIAMVKEDNRITAAAGAMGVPTKFPHPNAAIVFVNWLLSKDGQTVFSQSWGNPGTRADIPVEGIDPLFVPVPGQKYYSESEEALAARGRWLELAKKVIEEASR